jgi:hypothetical protein
MRSFLTRGLAALLGAVVLAGALVGIGNAQAPTMRAALLSASIDPDVQGWANAVVQNGGSVSQQRRVLVSRTVTALKAANTWRKIDDVWLLVAENAPQALTSLKQRRLATAVNSPIFTADRGYAFDGSTNYINTGFVPATDAVAMTGTSMRLAVYERTNIGVSATTAAGCVETGTKNLYLRPRNTTTVQFANLNSANAAFTLPSADSRGLHVVAKTGPDAWAGYLNAVSTGATSGLSTATDLPALAVYIGARNNVGSADQFRGSTVGWVSVAGALSAGEELAYYQALRTYMTAVGAAVP